MTDKEILEKAILKAIDGGWDYMSFEYNDEPGFTKKSHESFDDSRGVFITDWQSEIPYPHLIFNHNFAKALWGEHLGMEQAMPYIKRGATLKDLNRRKAWQYHLQQMVIAEDPIAYLGENI